MKKLYFLFLLLASSSIAVGQTSEMKKEEMQKFKEKIREQLQTPEVNPNQINGVAPFALASKNQSFGSDPAWNWTKQVGGSGIDNVNDIVTDSNGNYYITGSFSGDIAYSGNNYTSSGLRDAFVAKFDNSFNLQWFYQVNAESYKSINLHGIHVDMNGSVYATGFFTGNVQIGSYSLTSSETNNLFYLKLDNSGQVELAGSYDNGMNSGHGKSVLTDQNNNFYILSHNDIIKYDASGNIVWEISENEYFNDFILLNNKLYYIGFTESENDAIGSVSYSGNFAYRDLFVAKSDLSGNFSMVKLPQHYSTSGESRAHQMSADGNNNIYLTGSLGEDLVMDSVSLTGPRPTPFIIKMDTTGIAKWGVTTPFSTSASVPITTTMDSVTFIANHTEIFKYNSAGELVADVYGKSYMPGALYFNTSTDEIITAGNQEGTLYLSTLDRSLAETNLMAFSGNSGSIRIRGMVSDGSGNIYIQGQSVNSNDYFGETIPNGMFFAKHDPDGNLLWVKNIPKAFSGSGSGDQIVIDPNDAYLYVTGVFYEDINIPGGGTLTASEKKVYLLKYDVDGNFVYSESLSGLLGSNIDLTADHSGNLIFADQFADTIQVGNDSYIPFGSEDIVIIQYNSSGSIQWSKQAGGASTEYNGYTSVDASDNIYFTGEFISSNVQFGDSTRTLNDGDGNIFFAKMTTQGEVIWTTSHAGSVSPTNGVHDYYCWPTDMKTTPDGYTYIKGWHGDSVAFSDTAIFKTHKGNYGYFIGKFDPQGNAVWVHSIDEETYGFDYNQMDIDPYGNVYFGAQAKDTIYFKHYSDEFMYAPQGRYDLFLAKYTSDGDMDWIKTMGSQTGYTWFSAVAASDTNQVYATGYFNDYLSVGDKEYHAASYHSFVGRIGKKSSTSLAIQGNIYDMNEDSVTAGSVELYQYSEAGPFTMVKSLDLNGGSHYKFDSLSTMKYVVRVVPDTAEYPSLSPTYYGDAVSWENATLIDTETSGSMDSATIYLNIQTEHSGFAIISGSLTDTSQNEPVSDATVLLVDNSQSKAVLNMSRFTMTDNDGMYKFENIETGDYSVIIDIPGVTMEETKTVQVQTDQVEYLNNNYAKDSMSIFIEKAYLSGTVNDADGNPLSSGIVKIFDYDGAGILPLVDSVTISNGTFTSSNIPASKYLVKAYPDKEEYPNYVSTYYEQTFSWEEATPVSLKAFETTSVTLSPILIEESSGNATIEGKVESEETKIYKSHTEIVGKPVKSVSVVLVGKGEEKAAGDIMAMTETNDQGIYKFTKIEKGKYEILLDLPGASQATSYTVDVTSDSSSLSNYDYKVQGDTIYVDESSSPTLIGETEALKQLMVYPNPASDYIYINTKDAEIYRITLFDMTGKMVNKVKGNDSGVFRMNVNQYEGGMYLMKVETRKGAKTMKVFFRK